MGIRPAKCVRETDKRPYTRYADKVQRKNFLGGIPNVRIRQYNMGNMSRIYSHCVELVSLDSHNIRDNAFEAARLISNKEMGYTGKDTYFLRINVVPHNVLRENKVAQGNHADRISDGMGHCFGRPTGRSAIVKNGTILFEVFVDEKLLPNAQTALKKAKGKFGVKTDVRTRETTPEEKKRMSTIKRKLIEEVVIEEKPKEGEAAAAAGAAGAAAEAGKAEAGKTPAAGKEAGKAPAPAAGKEAAKPAGAGKKK